MTAARPRYAFVVLFLDAQVSAGGAIDRVFESDALSGPPWIGL